MTENCYVSIKFNNRSADVVAAKLLNEKVHLLCTKSFLLEGYFHGQIEDENLFEQSLQNILLSLSEQYKLNVDELIVVLPANDLKIYNAEVKMPIKTHEQIISQKEIDKARLECKNVKINDNDDECIVDENPIHFILDDGKTMRTSPINYSSSFLGLKSFIYSLPLNFVECLYNVFTKLNITMLAGYVHSFLPFEMYVEQFASEDGIVIVNISNDSTDISLFYKDQLIDHKHIYKGLNHCVQELERVLELEYEEAKELFYTYFVPEIDRASEISINPKLKISEKRISGIVLNQLFPLKDGIEKNVEDLLVRHSALGIESKKILCGQINDIDGIDSIFNNYQLGLVRKIGLLGNTFNDSLSAIYRYLRLNKDVINNILEDDDKPQFNFKNNTQNVDEGTSRFKDIFDE